MAILYYAIISITLFVCLGVVLWRNKTYQLPSEHVLNVFIIAPLAGLLSARLFHVFYEAWPIYKENPELIFEFWLGGYVYYAGVFGGLMLSFLYLKLKREPISPYMDLFIVPLSLGSGLGRWACVAAGCCYGSFCSLPWAIDGRHPTPIYSFLWEMLLVLILLRLEKKSLQWLMVPFWFAGHGLGRLMIEQLRGDDRGPIFLLSISSWISLVFIAVGFWLFLRRRTLKISSH